jgi:uroporphyrinogen-III synthase
MSGSSWNGTSSKPLEGKRVVVTRAPEQSAALARALGALGASVVFLPAIEFAEPEDFAPLDRAIRSLERFDWLVFTSGNAVRFFARRARTLGREFSGTGGQHPKVAAIGRATAEAARGAWLPVDYTAHRSTGDELARELRDQVRGGRVLLPVSDRARDELPRALAAVGAEVVQAIAYRTVSAAADDAALELLRGGEVDVVTFASPSAFLSLAEQVGLETLGKLTLAAIGPTTAQAIRAAGLAAAIEAREASSTGLAEAIAHYFICPDEERRDAEAAEKQ